MDAQVNWWWGEGLFGCGSRRHEGNLESGRECGKMKMVCRRGKALRTPMSTWNGGRAEQKSSCRGAEIVEVRNATDSSRRGCVPYRWV